MVAARPTLDLARYSETIRKTDTISINGRVAQVIGVLVESQGPACGVGEICELHCRRTQRPLLAEVVGFRGSRAGALIGAWPALPAMVKAGITATTASSRQRPTGRSSARCGFRCRGKWRPICLTFDEFLGF